MLSSSLIFLHSGDASKHLCSVKEPGGADAVGEDGGGRHYRQVHDSIFVIIFVSIFVIIFVSIFVIIDRYMTAYLSSYSSAYLSSYTGT